MHLGLSSGDLLNNYCQSDPVADVARGMFAVIVMLVYPIEVHVAQEVTTWKEWDGYIHTEPPIHIPLIPSPGARAVFAGGTTEVDDPFRRWPHAPVGRALPVHASQEILPKACIPHHHPGWLVSSNRDIDWKFGVSLRNWSKGYIQLERRASVYMLNTIAYLYHL